MSWPQTVTYNNDGANGGGPRREQVRVIPAEVGEQLYNALANLTPQDILASERRARENALRRYEAEVS